MNAMWAVGHKYFPVEVVSKFQIRFKGKAQADRESAAYMQYVSIYRRSATQPLSLRWGFENTSNKIPRIIHQGALTNLLHCKNQFAVIYEK
jgi:hypothetical protein